MEAGLQEADLVIAVTGSDELNLLCCTIAKKAGGELAAIARVRNPDYSEELPYLRQQLGLINDYQPGAGGRAGNRAPALPPAGADGQRVCQGARRAGALQDPQGEHPARPPRHAARRHLPISAIWSARWKTRGMSSSPTARRCCTRATTSRFWPPPARRTTSLKASGCIRTR